MDLIRRLIDCAHILRQRLKPTLCSSRFALGSLRASRPGLRDNSVLCEIEFKSEPELHLILIPDTLEVTC